MRRLVGALAALVDRPLAALAARAPVERPRDLEGRTVGVSGLPSDPAFLNAVVAHDGGDPEQIETITIGFTAVARLLSGRVDAAPIFWNAEGVVLRRRGLDEVRPVRTPSRRASPPRARTRRPRPSGSPLPPAPATSGSCEQVDAISGAWDLALDRGVLEDRAAFDARIGIVDAPPDVDTAFALP